MKKPILVSALLLLTIVISFAIPVPKYKSLEILGTLNIPTDFPGWQSIDVSEQLNIQDDRYNFISDVFARIYKNQKGEQLLFLILDAGNFHNPKVCYTSSGFTVKELDEAEFRTASTTFKTTALLMDRKDQRVVMAYWLCIDKKILGWTGQKMTELWSSLSNKKKAGLMVRLEIPAQGKTEAECLALGGEFISALSRNLTAADQEYLFGK